MPLVINYKETPQIKEMYPKREDLEIWLIIHGCKIRKLDANIDRKSLAAWYDKMKFTLLIKNIPNDSNNNYTQEIKYDW